MAVTVLRPDRTQYTGGWRVPPSGVELYPVLADNDDGTWIRGTIAFPNAGYGCRIGLSDPGALAANQRIMRIRQRVRYSRNGSFAVTQRARFTVSINEKYRLTTWSLAATTIATREANGPWLTVSGKGTEWTWADVRDVLWECIHHLDDDGANISMNVAEGFVDVDIHDQVTISGVTVSGQTETATPLVSFTFNTNVDNDPMRSRQVKVFTAAQVAAAGFNPATSTAYWDSGADRSNTTEVTVGRTLINGVTYRAYVRASQDFNNTDWWTDFSPSADFVMAYVPPPTPTLAITQEIVAPSLRNLLVVDTKLNLLSNDDASFEATLGSWGNNANAALAYLLGGSGAQTTLNSNPTFETNANGWTPTGGTFVRSTAQFQTGAASGLLTPTAATAYPEVRTNDGDITGVTAGQTYVWTGWARSPNAISFRPRIQWKKTDNTLISTHTGAKVTLVANTWTQFTQSLSAPALATRASVAVYIDNPSTPAADTLFIDEVRFGPFAVLPAQGAAMMRMTASGAGTMSAITAGGVFPYQIKAGQQYTAVASFRTAVTARSCNVKIVWVDTAGTTMSTSAGSNITDATGSWTQAFVTATAPAGAYGARIVVEVVSAAAAEVHYVDGVSLHIGSSTTWTNGGLQKNGSFGARFDHTVIEYLDRTVPSADTTNILYANIATGGDANGDAHGFAPRNPEDIVDVDRLGRQHKGEVCIRWAVGEATGSVLDLGTAQGVFSSFSETPEAVLPGVPGRVYALSGRIRAVAGSHDMALALVAIDKDGAVVGSATVGSTVSVGTAYSQLSVIHTVPAGAAAMRAEVRNLNGDLAEYLLDSFQLEEAAVVTAWKRPTFFFGSWQAVRGALTALQGDVRDGIARIYDREVPPGVIRMYRAWTEVDAGGGSFARSAYTAYIPTQIDFPADCTHILKDPQQPAWDLQINVEQVGEHIDEDFTEAHPVRPNDRQPYGQRPVFVSDWISGKNGQLAIRVRGDEDWFALQALLHTPRTLLLQIHGGGQRYVRFRSRSWPRSKQSTQLWKVVVDFSEVARPVVTA